MLLELHCPCCTQDFSVPADSPAAAALEEMAEEGPWSELGDGKTTEDRVYWALSSRGPIHCPDCGGVAETREESLSAFASELLKRW